MDLPISNEKLSAIISLVVAISVLIASFFQWWDITYNGGMIIKKWARIFLITLLLFLLLALVLIF